MSGDNVPSNDQGRAGETPLYTAKPPKLNRPGVPAPPQALLARILAGQRPEGTGADASLIYAPQRGPLRRAWEDHSHASHPELLPWDLGLAWAREETETSTEYAGRLGEALVMHQYGRLDLRYTVTPTRQEAFAIMGMMGLTVIPHGRVSGVPSDWERVVVYTSEYGGHVGQDKVLMSLEDARREWPGALCSRFMVSEMDKEAPDGAQGMSERDLVAGDFLLRARMYGSGWRSNVGAVDVRWRETLPRHAEPRYATGWEAESLCGPLFAIDFVWHAGVRYAVDFNVCPGATEAPLHDLPGGSLMGAVQAWSGWTMLEDARVRYLPEESPAQAHARTLEQLSPEGRRALGAFLLEEGYPAQMVGRLTLDLFESSTLNGVTYDSVLLDFSGARPGLGLGRNDGNVMVRSVQEFGEEGGAASGVNLVAWVESPATWEALGFGVQEFGQGTGEGAALLLTPRPGGPDEGDAAPARLNKNNAYGYVYPSPGAPEGEVVVTDGMSLEDGGGVRNFRALGEDLLARSNRGGAA